MQSKTTRGLRRLLVSTGVISLVFSVAAPAALAEKPDDRKVWVCHGTGSLSNPYVLDHVSVNAKGHEDAEVISTDPLPFGETLLHHTSDLQRLTHDEQATVVGDTCGGTGSHGEDEELEGEIEEDLEGETEEDELEGEIEEEEFEDETKDEPTDPGNADPKPEAEVKPRTEVKPEPKQKPAPVISTVTVTRPAPATPATPAAPTVPAAPQAPVAPQAPATPATPAAQAVTNTPTAPVPSVAVSATSKGNEVLGSVTTRTPGGAQVTALAATGTSTTVALAALGAVLLLAGFGLQVTARRVQSSAVEA